MKLKEITSKYFFGLRPYIPFLHVSILIMLSVQSCSLKQEATGEKGMRYKVEALKGTLEIDANWEKKEWKKVPELELTNFMLNQPEFPHKVEAKIMYDASNIYVIFRVEDKYVRCVTDSINGPVWGDACVEFFFAPDTALPMQYFNLEINCGGTPLMHYNRIASKDWYCLEVEEIKQVEIASSMPGLVDPEVEGPVTWTLEYRIPLAILRKYCHLAEPAPGVQWRANFYKIAHFSSHPHYITWSPIDRDGPEFHLPEFFGIIEFK